MFFIIFKGLSVAKNCLRPESAPLINLQPDIDKTYWSAKYRNEAKHQFLIKKREEVVTKHFNDSKAFIEYSNDMDHIYKNIEKYNPNKKRKILIVFDNKIADMLNNKKT